jgi:hypothetical protein
MELEWVVLGSFGSGRETDIARQTLEVEAIPVLVRGNQAGSFGGAFQGAVNGGVELLVPETELACARALVGADGA